VTSACLESLNAAASPNQREAVFILINYKAEDDDQVKSDSQSLYDQLHSANENLYPKLEIQLFIQELIDKKSGVGLARKLLMDAGFLYFLKADRNGLLPTLQPSGKVLLSSQTSRPLACTMSTAFKKTMEKR